MIGPVRAVHQVTQAPSVAWLRRRRDGLEAQHRALGEGRFDDLVELLGDDREAPDGSGGNRGDEGERHEAADESSEQAAHELTREVEALARSLETRIARLRGETLAELRELDGRITATRFGAGSRSETTGRRGGSFNGYL